MLIFVHELGHFVASLGLGMRPRRFYIGFPPAIAKTTRGGVEYGIGAIPLGGFVKIPGMHRPAPADVDAAFGRAVEEHPSLAARWTACAARWRKETTTPPEQTLEVVRELVAELQLSEPAARAAERGIDRHRDALGPRRILARRDVEARGRHRRRARRQHRPRARALHGAVHDDAQER